MKRILVVLLVLVTSITAFAQKVDFTTYDVIAKAGDVTIIMKNNDYRMIVGSVKKPKLNMLMGYSKEQAINRIDRILDFSKDGYTKKNRMCQYVESCSYLLLQEKDKRKHIILRHLTLKESLT